MITIDTRTTENKNIVEQGSKNRIYYDLKLDEVIYIYILDNQEECVEDLKSNDNDKIRSGNNDDEKYQQPNIDNKR